MGDWVEFTAKTLSDALTEASVSLQVPSSMIEYEVIEEQKNGLLGLFSRPAKIRARVKREEKTSKKEEKTEILKTVQEKKIEVPKPLEPLERKIDTDVETAAKKFLNDVFEAMEIKANVIVSLDEKEGSVNVNIEGDDMGILIGKRGQTLDSLQYLTSLVINKGTTSYLKIKLDTENYRQRRKETLENLAKNLAYKVKRTKRPVSLEPMNPYERRIIHSSLQNDKYVDTHSEGDEPYRKVVITLKKGYREYNNSSRTNHTNNHYNTNRKDYKKNISEKETTEVKSEE